MNKRIKKLVRAQLQIELQEAVRLNKHQVTHCWTADSICRDEVSTATLRSALRLFKTGKHMTTEERKELKDDE